MTYDMMFQSSRVYTILELMRKCLKPSWIGYPGATAPRKLQTAI